MFDPDENSTVLIAQSTASAVVIPAEPITENEDI
jgi:hypothetical protein